MILICFIIVYIDDLYFLDLGIEIVDLNFLKDVKFYFIDNNKRWAFFLGRYSCVVVGDMVEIK